MLDNDLAEMYGIETKQLKRQVKRNIERFPEEFMFVLNKQELESLRSQIGTTSWGGSRYLPFAFTEHGVLMLSSVLKSAVAIQLNIAIIKTFTKLREAVKSNNEILLKIEKMDKKLGNIAFDVKLHDEEIETIFKVIDELRENKEKQNPPRIPIGFQINTKKK